MGLETGPRQIMNTRTRLLYSMRLVFLACAMGLGACSGSGSSDGGSTPIITECGPAQEMAGFYVDWEYTQCPKTDTIRVDYATLGAGDAPLGVREVSWGMLSVKYHGLNNDLISADPNYGIMFKATGLGMGEANWHFIAHNVENNVISTRLILQRFDGSCHPYCEENYSTYELQFDNDKEEIRFDCAWSLSEMMPSGKIWCSANKLASGQTVEYWTVMKGIFVSLDYAGVGKKAFDGPYPGFPAQVSDFKMTIFQ